MRWDQRVGRAWTCVAALLGLGGAGCSTRSSSDAKLNYAQAQDQIVPPLCARLSACNPKAFDTAFSDGGAAACRSVLEGAVQNPNASTNCTQADVERCATDIQAEPCDTLKFSPFELPASCNGC